MNNKKGIDGESMKCHILPDLVKGIRVRYRDKDEKSRVETIYLRSENTITVINILKEKTKIELDRVTGYWRPRVKASSANMIRTV